MSSSGTAPINVLSIEAYLNQLSNTEKDKCIKNIFLILNTLDGSNFYNNIKSLHNLILPDLENLISSPNNLVKTELKDLYNVMYIFYKTLVGPYFIKYNMHHESELNIMANDLAIEIYNYINSPDKILKLLPKINDSIKCIETIISKIVKYNDEILGVNNTIAVTDLDINYLQDRLKSDPKFIKFVNEILKNNHSIIIIDDNIIYNPLCDFNTLGDFNSKKFDGNSYDNSIIIKNIFSITNNNEVIKYIIIETLVILCKKLIYDILCNYFIDDEYDKLMHKFFNLYNKYMKQIDDETIVFNNGLNVIIKKHTIAIQWINTHEFYIPMYNITDKNFNKCILTIKELQSLMNTLNLIESKNYNVVSTINDLDYNIEPTQHIYNFNFNEYSDLGNDFIKYVLNNYNTPEAVIDNNIVNYLIEFIIYKRIEQIKENRENGFLFELKDVNTHQLSLFKIAASYINRNIIIDNVINNISNEIYDNYMVLNTGNNKYFEFNKNKRTDNLHINKLMSINVTHNKTIYYNEILTELIDTSLNVLPDLGIHKNLQSYNYRLFDYLVSYLVNRSNGIGYYYKNSNKNYNKPIKIVEFKNRTNDFNNESIYIYISDKYILIDNSIIINKKSNNEILLEIIVHTEESYNLMLDTKIDDLNAYIYELSKHNLILDNLIKWNFIDLLLEYKIIDIDSKLFNNKNMKYTINSYIYESNIISILNSRKLLFMFIKTNTKNFIYKCLNKYIHENEYIQLQQKIVKLLYDKFSIFNNATNIYNFYNKNSIFKFKCFHTESFDCNDYYFSYNEESTTNYLLPKNILMSIHNIITLTENEINDLIELFNASIEERVSEQ